MRRLRSLAGHALLLASLSGCGGGPQYVRISSHDAASSVRQEAANPGAMFAEAERYDFDDDLAMAGGFSANEAALRVSAARPTIPAPRRAKTEAPEDPSSESQLPTSRAPMLVYTARLVMAVFEVESSLSAVEELARETGGFLSKRERTAITIRVPADRFDEVVRKLEKLGDVHERNIVANDVTDEFYDLEARLRSARAVQGRLIELLAKANTVQESVTIERELGRVNQDVERLEGRLKLLRDQLAYSTITATFRPKNTEIVNKQGSFRLPGEWLDQLGLGRLLRL